MPGIGLLLVPADENLEGPGNGNNVTMWSLRPTGQKVTRLSDESEYLSWPRVLFINFLQHLLRDRGGILNNDYTCSMAQAVST